MDTLSFISSSEKPKFFNQRSSFASLTTVIIISVVGPFWECLTGISSTIKNHPADTISVAGALLLNHTKTASEFPLIPIALATFSAGRQFKNLASEIQVFKASTTLDRVCKLTLYGATLLMCAQIPNVAARDFMSIKAIKNTYNGKACETTVIAQFKQIHACYEEKACQAHQDVEFDHQIFTRNHGETVSISFLKRNEFCVLSQLERSEPVTKLCFNPTTPSQRSISSLESQVLDDNLDYLRTPGTSQRFIGIANCGGLRSTTTPIHLEKPICILTGLTPKSPVTQTCFDSTDPSLITVKEITGIELEFKDSETPASLLIREPQRLNIDPQPETSKNSCECESKN